MFREFLISTKAMLKVFIWEPIKRVAGRLWDVNFGPCCDNPNLTVIESPGITVTTCSNCKKAKTYTRAGF
jgi:hypothetical protein